MGRDVCLYGVFSSITSQDTCRNSGHVWYNNKCYSESDTNYQISCSDNYVYISDPNKYITGTGMGGGCFPYKEKEYTCSEGTLNGTNCIITIPAIKK